MKWLAVILMAAGLATIGWFVLDASESTMEETRLELEAAWANPVVEELSPEGAHTISEVSATSPQTSATGGSAPSTSARSGASPRAWGFLETPLGSFPIVTGVDDDDLLAGVGWLPETPKPGSGVTVIAGHRATGPEPFAHFDRLKDGDRVRIRLQDKVYTYELVKDWKIKDGEGLVIPRQTSENDLLLVTCHPRWGHGERWIYKAELIKEQSV